MRYSHSRYTVLVLAGRMVHCMSESENRSGAQAQGEKSPESRAIDKWRHQSPPNPPTAFRLTVGVPGPKAAPPPPPLWHYTTFDALESITRTGLLWASRIQFLNDEKELQHAWDVISDAVQNRLHRVGAKF